MLDNIRMSNASTDVTSKTKIECENTNNINNKLIVINDKTNSDVDVTLSTKNKNVNNNNKSEA